MTVRPGRLRFILPAFAMAVIMSGPDTFAQTAESESNAPASSLTLRSISRTSLAIGVGLGTAALIARQYRDTELMAMRLDRSPADGLIDIADVWGAGTTMGLAAAGLLALGETTDRSSFVDAGKDLSTSLLTTWTAVWALKVSINAKRPNGGSYSFPSGHTATAFAAAPVLSKHFGPLVGYPSYGLAAFTGLARIEERKHHLTDILVGAAIGLVIGREVAGRDGSGWILVPNGSGIGISLRF